MVLVLVSVQWQKKAILFWQLILLITYLFTSVTFVWGLYSNYEASN